MSFGSGSGSNRPVENLKINFGGPSHPTRLKHSSGYTTESGIVKPWLKSLLEIATDEGSSSKSLFENDLVKVYPVVLANDRTALKPGFQFDEEQNHVVGLDPKADYNFVKNNSKPDTEMLRSAIITEANVSYASLIDNTSPTLSGDGQIVRESNCKSECGQCIELVVVCTECTDIGHQSTKPPLRACDHCVKDGRQCIRTLVVAVTADCEQGNKNAFQMIINDREAGQLDQSYLFRVFQTPFMLARV
ncbi:unnamed protein product [Mytilus coruscus]|uniref:Uncharacterized protein n=1 Tax=Mytilus coruscus TaxID=42192 RepID=A0A6J8B5G9_MYTCO|nr:unnamed protein product [Mytilus coruscus]